MAQAAHRSIKADDSPFGLHESRGDLRGIDLRAVFDTKFRRLRFEEVDLGGATLGQNVIQDSEFVDVVLDGADLVGVSDQGNRWVRCSFRRADFRTAGLGYKGSRYESCVFERAEFHKTVFGRAEFDDCRFEHCNLKGVDFFGSSFVRCTFVGVLDDVWFRGTFPDKRDFKEFGRPRPNRMDYVDLRDAVLHWPTLSDGVDLSTIVPPADGRHVIVDARHERLQRFRALAAEAPERLRPVAEHFLTAFSGRPEQHWQILNIDDLVQEWGPAGADFIVEGLGFDQRA
ncbi:MAG: pentapeptide repeat-containing protein [Actinobacteria bacterium]|nr:pentapeptide repeat-containing protein [Actinomycetota bacterium]